MARRVARTPVLPTGLPKLDPALGPLNRTLYQSLIDHSNRINGGIQADGSEGMTGPLPLAQVTTANLPAPAEWEGATLYVTDGGTGGSPALMYSDGTQWVEVGSGSGSGLQPANNLSDVANAATSFDNIKQPSTTSYPGVIRLATEAEIRANADAIAVPSMGTLLDANDWFAMTMGSPTTSFDWANGPMQYLEMDGDSELGNPSNAVPGTFRTIHVFGEFSVDRTLTFASNYGGLHPTLPDISDTKHYMLTVLCVTATHFLVTAIDGSPP